MPTCGDYTMRTQPRRRVSEGNGGTNKEEPIFLRKTFEMICSCDSDRTCDLACWTQNGETFVVKDPDVFSQVVIPKFFKRERVCGASPQTVHGVVASDRQITKRSATRAPQSFGGNHCSVGSCYVCFLACCLWQQILEQPAVWHVSLVVRRADGNSSVGYLWQSVCGLSRAASDFQQQSLQTATVVVVHRSNYDPATRIAANYTQDSEVDVHQTTTTVQ